LADAILDPIETHVHGFGSFLFDCFVGEADGGRVVGLQRGTIAATQSTATVRTAQAVIQLLNYAATNPDAVI
jgi:hypothetical protein